MITVISLGHPDYYDAELGTTANAVPTMASRYQGVTVPGDTVPHDYGTWIEQLYGVRGAEPDRIGGHGRGANVRNGSDVEGRGVVRVLLNNSTFSPFRCFITYSYWECKECREF